MKNPALHVAAALALSAALLAACGGGNANNANNESAASAAADNAAASNAAPNAMGTGETAGATGGAIPDCGTERAVWVNTKTKVAHEPSDPLYGKTKHGMYLCPAQALAQGYHMRGAGGMRSHHNATAAPNNG